MRVCDYILASSVNIGQMVGCLLGGYCGGRFGPRTAILSSCLPAALSWTIIACSPHLATLILGRVLCGLCSSFCSANLPLLVAQYRWVLSTVLHSTVQVGTEYSIAQYSTGGY